MPAPMPYGASLKALRPDVQLLGQSWRKVGETDLAPYITPAMNAQPDCIISAAGGGGVVNFLKAVKAMGLEKKIPIYQHYATDTLALRPLGLDAPEGIMGSSSYHFYYPNIPENKAFTDEFMKVYKRYPGSTAFYGYVAGHAHRQGVSEGRESRTASASLTPWRALSSTAPSASSRCAPATTSSFSPCTTASRRRSPAYNFLIGSNMVTIPGKDYLPSCEEIMKLRGGGK